MKQRYALKTEAAQINCRLCCLYFCTALQNPAGGTCVCAPGGTKILRAAENGVPVQARRQTDCGRL
jgi:hypothetical protein